MSQPIRRAPLSQTVLEEIALEGLEGITLPSLWAYLSKDLDVPLPLPIDIQNRVWLFIKRHTFQLAFYELPTDRPTAQCESRYAYVDADFGVPLSPDPEKFCRYKFVPIEDGDIRGSCEHYKERKLIDEKEVCDLNVDDVLERWGNRFVIVASQELRFSVLTPMNVPIQWDMPTTQYCILEAIGRARFNGETTSGPYSLLQHCKDPSVVFYMKKKLSHLGLISQQPFNEFRDDRLMITSLLTLPRFMPNLQRNIVTLMEKIYAIVKESANGLAPVMDLRAVIPTFARKSAFRRIVLSHIFRRIFEMKTVPYSQAYGSPRKASGSGKERAVSVITLRNPDTPLEEIIEEETDEESEEEVNFTNAFVDEKHSFVDMPLKEEFYRAVLRHGARGCSHTEICNYLSIPHVTVRQLVKRMERDGLIKPYCVDEGRQRINRYVAVEILNKEKATNTQDTSQVQFTDFLTVPHVEDTYVVDLPLIDVNIQPYYYRDKHKIRESLTVRQRARRAFIIEQINENAILQSAVLRGRLHQNERAHGYTDEICLKSFARLLMNLNKTDNLHVYEVILKYEKQSRIYRYVAHPKVDTDHIIMQREVKRLKNSFFLLLEQRSRNEQQRKVRDTQSASSRKTLKSVERKCDAAKSSTEHSVKPPKFLISRYMHEFLFYIVVELQNHQQTFDIDESLLQHWQEVEPALQVNEYLKSMDSHLEQRAYTQQISWRTFIPPLPNYADKPAGWVYFVDAIDRMPLSIFNKIFRFEKTAGNKLEEYLTHPVRQHYLLRQLPAELQQRIPRTYLHRICTLVLKLLNHMGLIQVGEVLNSKDPLMIWVYLNRRTQIRDTTPTEASYAKVNLAQKYEELDFYFSVFDDLNQYWTQLHRICLYTRLGLRSAKNGEKSEMRKELHFLPSVGFDEAPQYDTGEVPGDRAGAAGFSAHLYAHAFRNWSWVLRTNVKPRQIRTGRISVGRGGTSKHMRVLGLRKNRILASQVKRLQHVATTKRSSSSKKSASMRDAIDRDALKNMRTLRVNWDKEEDYLLKLSRAVYLYLGAPVAVLGLMTVGKICRDVIRHNVNICNKTSQACLRRTQYIVKKQRHVPEVPTWVHTLQTNAQIQKRYGDNFLQRLKSVYPQREEYCDALVLHFIHIFNFLYQLTQSARGKVAVAAVKPRFMIPDTVAEFDEIFQKCPTAAEERNIQYTNPSNENEALIILAIGVLHSSLCSARDKTTYTAQAFEIYKHFSEEVLQSAFAKARNDTLVVVNKRKNFTTLPCQLTSPAYTLSSHYQRRLIFLRLPYAIYNSYFGFFENALNILMKPAEEFSEMPSTSKGPPVKNVVELKSPNAGQLFFIAEGLALNLWTCKIKLPINILTVDAEQRQTLSSMDRILDHYHCIFDNAPQTEYTKSFETETNEKQVRVKFHPANLSYKITYNPYDFISKLPVRHLHFFCALDHLNQDIEINFSRLMHKDDEYDTLRIECPFNCILKHANYINAIERIVQEKQSILRELTEMPPQKLLNIAMSGSSVTVHSSNLLTLVRMLESFWREKETVSERKDLGRISANVKINKFIDWHQLCKEILEFNAAYDDNDKTDEYEPTLNKEERTARAQDVFVVNLPTLQFEVNPNLLLPETETVMHSGMSVPKCIVETEVERDAILRKIVEESHWKYTENTFDMLKSKLNNLGFNAMEQQHLEDLNRFIEVHKIGVPITDLLREFPYVQFLSRALRLLSEHNLIKRVGVATMMYVHKSHIRPWVVHTFHLKRLERENLGPDGTVNFKRIKLTESTNTEEEESDEPGESSVTKRVKLIESVDSAEEQLTKRLSKPVKRFQNETTQATPGERESRRDVIVMKPHPWLRLNGTINRRVLDRWLGSILTECISRTGCSVSDVTSKFPHLPPVEIMFLLEILCDLKCIHLTEIKPTLISLFSTYENIQETIVTELYDPKHTYVTAHADALMRMSIFIGHKKYSTQFI